jgi:hypothetical protein
MYTYDIIYVSPGLQKGICHDYKSESNDLDTVWKEFNHEISRFTVFSADKWKLIEIIEKEK